MKKTFLPAHLTGTVSAPASKSEAHRRMICAGLTQGETMLTGFMDSADMAATMRCLGALGSTFNRDGDTLTIKRMLEDGYMTIKVKTPCMITCIKELNTPRYLSVGGAFECYSKPLVTMTYETLKDHPLIDKSTIGLAGSPTNILTSFTPPQKGAGMMLEGADKATTDKLAGILAAKHII